MSKVTVEDLYAVEFGTYVQLTDGRRAMRNPFGWTLYYKEMDTALEWVTKSTSAKELIELGVERIEDE